MRILFDTNILLRTAQPTHPQHHEVLDATHELIQRGYESCIVPQCQYEFWVVATRPQNQNGLEFTAVQTEAELARLRASLVFLNDPPDLFAEWKQLVTSLAVMGKNAHDARFAAAMMLHGIHHLLTYNVRDFQRYPGIVPLSPSSVLSQLPP